MQLDTVKILNTALQRFKKIWLKAAIGLIVSWIVNAVAIGILMLIFVLIISILVISQSEWLILLAIPVGLGLIFLFFVIFYWVNLAYFSTVISEDEKQNIFISLSSTFSLAKSFTFFSIKRGIFFIGLFAFFLIPGIIWSVWDAFSDYVFLLDPNSRGGLRPLYKSRGLIRGYFWKVAAMLILFQITANAIGISIVGLDESSAALMLAGIINLILIFVVNPFFLLVFHEMYKSLQAQNQPPSSTPVLSIIFSTLGWVIIILLFFLFFIIVADQDQNSIENNFLQIDNIQINQDLQNEFYFSD